MWLIRLIENIIEDPAKLNKVKKSFLVFGVVLVLFDGFLIYSHLTHAVFPWDHVPGFSTLYGLLSTYLIVVISKWVGHTFLMKREDYYD